MEALFIFILKSSALLILFYTAYYFLLRKETFFNANRWFLLIGLGIAVLLPFLVYTKTVWIDPDPVSDLNFQELYNTETTQQENPVQWNYILLFLYGMGLLTLLVKFALDFYKLNSIIKGKKVQQQADFKFIDLNENIAPFSYFEYIVYNSSLYSSAELENILEHEKVHSDQNHTVDVLISRVFCILFWFNPIIWLYKKAITQNLEFIADSEAFKKIEDKKAYQYTLLKITTHQNCVAITNHFYQSLIKKRIVMLNKNQSKKKSIWKHFVIVPALGAFVLLFQVEVVAKERQKITKESNGEIKSVDVYKIKKNTTDLELKKIKENLKSLHNIDFEASEIKRNTSNDLTSLKIDVKYGSQTAQSIQTRQNTAIQDFAVVVTTDKNDSKKVGIQTFDKEITVNSEPKVGKSKKLNSKSQTNVSTNSNIITKTDHNSNTNFSTTVITTNDNSTKLTLSKTGSKIAISDGTKANGKKEPMLVIVNGEEMPAGFDYNDINAKDIETVNVLKGETAVSKYGEKGKDGVLIIQTRN
ncbi:M56 family metallopeptidase [Flavobacterium hungaricum]|uniref:M56 family peptidase n=1 Tax=Flavobacterium hungaricum TaxID=2082725 RepID=A0ABR9TIW8_9FLAO|nr:M56 family metallopeptidase [Flavobacterium hungaricum]MBE8724809.1 M56 family peptidase [Flavobacterium hungaricum]